MQQTGRRLAVRLSATTVEILDGGKTVARHERAAGRYVEVLLAHRTLPADALITAMRKVESSVTEL